MFKIELSAVRKFFGDSLYVYIHTNTYAFCRTNQDILTQFKFVFLLVLKRVTIFI